MEQQNPPVQNRSTRSTRFFNHVHRFKNVLRRLWWILLLTLIVSVGVRAFIILRQPPLYVSSGQMTVSIKIQIPTGSVYSEEVSQFLGTQIAFMKSDEVKSHSAERVRALKPDLPASGVSLQIGVLPKTTIFNLQAIGTDPEYTRAYLDACMEEYINFKRKLRTATSENTLASITEQLVSLERELKKYEAQLLAFQESNSVVFLQEQGNSAGSYLAKLNGQLAEFKSDFQLLTMLDLDQNLERAQNKEPGNGRKTTDPVSAGILQTGYLKAKQDIQLMKAELKECSTYLKPKHPRVIQLNEDIARQEQLLEIYKQQSLDQLESRRNSLSLQIKNTENDIKEWEVKSLDASRRMADYERIRASKQRVQSLYDRLLGATQSLGVDKDISQESVAIMQRATPAVLAEVNIAKQLIVAAAFGLLAGIVILIIIDRFDDRPSSFSELQDIFDEPVLGQIPLQHKTGKNPEVQLLQIDDDRHSFMEAYRNLRSSLLYMATEGKRPKLLLVTSAIPSDGKSMTAANLAITLAHSGSRVLLVDADMRRGQLHQHFQINFTVGLNEVLSKGIPWTQAVQTTAVTNLSLLPRGEFARSPGELFLSQTMLNFLKESRENYDYVIIDTAPVMAADDVTSLAPHGEGVIFVIRAACTSARVARAALDLLYQRDVEVLGLVFNGVESTASEYYYYKYKSYYAEPRST